MTNFNTCEKEHSDIEGFFREVAAAAAEGHISGTLDTHDTRPQTRPFSLGPLLGFELKQTSSNMAQQPYASQIMPEREI